MRSRRDIFLARGRGVGPLRDLNHQGGHHLLKLLEMSVHSSFDGREVIVHMGLENKLLLLQEG